VAIPVSIFEREGPHYFNSLVMLDADGAALGVYRKSHIPDGPGYQEKYYFRPGRHRLPVWNTRHGRIGVGICWDQWYPECGAGDDADGAEVLMYPTAIGSEPHDASLDTAEPWRRAMQGHAVSNIMPGGRGQPHRPRTLGRLSERPARPSTARQLHRRPSRRSGRAGPRRRGVLVHTFDLDFLDRHRAAWGFFRDRRPDLYGALTETPPGVIETPRLILRDWREEDLEPFAALNADPEVMRYFPSTHLARPRATPWRRATSRTSTSTASAVGD
jgi:N-carbamoylputrescine amidase